MTEQIENIRACRTKQLLHIYSIHIWLYEFIWYMYRACKSYSWCKQLWICRNPKPHPRLNWQETDRTPVAWHVRLWACIRVMAQVLNHRIQQRNGHRSFGVGNELGWKTKCLQVSSMFPCFPGIPAPMMGSKLKHYIIYIVYKFGTALVRLNSIL